MSRKSIELQGFVHDALARGIPRAEITHTLRQAGWDASLVEEAIGAYADIEFPLPVPRAGATYSAREAFHYLVLFAALAMFAYSLATLLFDIIDSLMPNPGDPTYLAQWRESSIRWAVARIVVGFPLFALMAWRIDRAIVAGQFNPNSPVRLWLSYLAMFIAVTTLVSDLVTLIAYLLGGEATARFLIKVAVVALIAFSVITYYLWDLRRAERGL